MTAVLDDRPPGLEPVFRSANPYAEEIDAEDSRARADASGSAPAHGAGLGHWPRPTWSLIPEQALEPADGWGLELPGHRDSGVWSPWAPPAPRRPRRRRPSLGALTAILLVLGVGSIVAGAEVGRLTASSAGPVPASPAGPQTAGSGSSSSATSSAPVGGGAPSAAPQTAAPAPSGPPMTADEIAGAVDPAVVDITSSLSSEGEVAAGTGMLLTSTGEVLTNNHVVAGASRIRVRIGGRGDSRSAHLLAADPGQDIAVIQVEGVSGLPTVTIGDSSSVVVGDSVVALGNALGRDGPPTPASGQVVALDQTITASDQGGGNSETLSGLMEIDARIQPGDSGGPLLDDRGQVVGMDTAATASHRRSGATQGYAIPISAAMADVQQLAPAATGPPAAASRRALLGVEVQDAGSGAGALVVAVTDEGPAAAAGIEAGDIITGVGGAAVDSATSLGREMSRHAPGDSVDVDWVDSSGQHHSAAVTLASDPAAG